MIKPHALNGLVNEMLCHNAAVCVACLLPTWHPKGASPTQRSVGPIRRDRDTVINSTRTLHCLQIVLETVRRTERKGAVAAYWPNRRLLDTYCGGVVWRIATHG